MAVKINELREKLSEALTVCQDVEICDNVREAVLQAETDGTNTVELYNELIKKLSGNG